MGNISQDFKNIASVVKVDKTVADEQEKKSNGKEETEKSDRRSGNKKEKNIE